MDLSEPLTKRTREVVRKIAQEDGTNFAQAARGLEELNQFVEKTRKILRKELKGCKLDAEIAETKKRIYEMRKTLKVSLLEAVNLYSHDPVINVEKRETRMCREEKCKNHTTETSYYWCESHKKHYDVDEQTHHSHFNKRNGRYIFGGIES